MEVEKVTLHDLGEYMHTSAPVSHNPLTWNYNDGSSAAPTLHLGSIDIQGENLWKTGESGGFVSAVATKEGALRIDDQTYRPYTKALETGGGDYHGCEIKLWWPNLRHNIHQRATAFLQRCN